MTREELKVHCERQIKECEMWAKYCGKEPGGKLYEEHKLILELLQTEPCEKTGKWKKCWYNMITHDAFDFECSRCGQHSTFTHSYCPNCGAKMQMEVEK